MEDWEALIHFFVAVELLNVLCEDAYALASVDDKSLKDMNLDVNDAFSNCDYNKVPFFNRLSFVLARGLLIHTMEVISNTYLFGGKKVDFYSVFFAPILSWILRQVHLVDDDVSRSFGISAGARLPRQLEWIAEGNGTLQNLYSTLLQTQTKISSLSAHGVPILVGERIRGPGGIPGTHPLHQGLVSSSLT